MEKSIRLRILLITALLIGLSILSVSLFSLTNLYDFTLGINREHLGEEVRIIRNLLSTENLSIENRSELDALCDLLGKGNSTRISLFSLDGTVLGDSKEEAKIMENHSGRPEFQEAMEGAEGYDIRRSSTLNIEMLYIAAPVYTINGEKKGIVRTAYPITEIQDRFREIVGEITVISIVIMALAFFLSRYLVQNLVKQIDVVSQAVKRYANGNFNQRLSLPETRETIELSHNLNAMADQLADRIETITMSNNRLNAILNSMREAVIVMDKEMRITSVNPAAKNMFPRELSDACSESILEIFRNSELSRTLINLEQGIIEKSDKTFMVNHLQQKRYLQMSASFLHGQEECIEGYMLVLNDISTLIRLEKIRKDFVANVSHELKTPVTSIQGFVETLLSGSVSDEENRDRFLGIIERQTKRLNAIIEDLLILSRLESTDELETKKQELELDSLLEHCKQNCLIKARHKNIQINNDCEENIELKVNPILFEQALVNLLDNAIKYSPDHTEVFVQGFIEEDSIVISIKDQGMGIPVKDQSRVFERFYRVDKARSRTMGGTGLGLAIVKHIILLHKGEIDLESRLGAGSCFTIRLPLERV